jgi:hypothetical protein
LRAAADQQPLQDILAKTGESVTDAYESLVNVAADEEITQEQYGFNERRSETSHHHFGYLITVDKQPGRDVLHEYRTDAHLKPVESTGTGQGFPFTTNSASMWVLFYPENQSQTRFRYLGEQPMGGQNLYAVAFATVPGKASVTGRINLQGRSALVLYQGVAWIDSTSFRIAKLRLDLLQPRLDVGLERMTTEIQFGEARVAQAAVTLWLPQSVTVTAVSSGQLFRNEYAYSNFRLFTVSSETKVKNPEQAAPK